MSTAMLARVPAIRRNELFHDIARLIEEAGAIDRSLAHIGEGWAVDETLEQIVERIDDELRPARRSCRLAKILKLEDAGNAA